MEHLQRLRKSLLEYEGFGPFQAAQVIITILTGQPAVVSHGSISDQIRGGIGTEFPISRSERKEEIRTRVHNLLQMSHRIAPAAGPERQLSQRQSRCRLGIAAYEGRFQMPFEHLQIPRPQFHDRVHHLLGHPKVRRCVAALTVGLLERCQRLHDSARPRDFALILQRQE